MFRLRAVAVCEVIKVAPWEPPDNGTARGAGAALEGTTWQLGGKTGSGPAGVTPSDGWFAGLIFERGEPRYTVAVYVDGRGVGGGVAASIAAKLARAPANTRGSLGVQ